MNGRRALSIAAAIITALAVLTATAYGHVERSSYWPDPAPDKSVRPAAGGKVPKARSLASALKRKARGDTRVVCQRGSLKRAIRSINSAHRKGWVLRPSQGSRKLSARNTRRLKRQNRAFFRRCRFHSIQTAIKRSRTGDRVIVMPGRYVEPKSRVKPTNDPKCAQYREKSDDGNGAATFKYQVKCPNDQNLIYLQGRALVSKPPPNPPLVDRHGIPDNGRCIRCNVQIDGTGAKPEDTVVDLAKNTHAKLRGPSEAQKEVGIRADRADGLVIRNMSFAHAAEHGVYIHETDGYRLQRVKFFWNQEYGALMFTSDHGLTADCEGMGSGDSAVYPGGAPDTGEQTVEPRQRVNQLITRCDIHHNTLGYSGTMGNGTRVAGNHFYDNGTAIATDSFYAGGHPGYPQDSARFEKNQIYSNNFNSFLPGSDVAPRVPTPVGVGILIAGGNNNNISGNRIYDNWRRGTMQLYVPDSLSDSSKTSANSTSHRNRYHDNVMGVAPNGTKMPNGVDFWWDEAPAQMNNCWYHNGDVTTDPQGPLMPSDCNNTSAGVTYGAKVAGEIGPCAASVTSDQYDATTCPWFRTPDKPSGDSGGMPGLPIKASGAPKLALFSDGCRLVGTTLSCEAFSDRP